MARELSKLQTTDLAAMEALAERARDYQAAAKAAATRRAYAADLRAFAAWCEARGLQAMPASAGTVAAYLTDHAGRLKVSTLTRRLSAIREAHRYAGHELDTASVAFRDLWRGIRKAHGAPARQKAALLTAALRKSIAALPDTLVGKRDRALLLIGFAAALRRSELVGLEARQRDGALGWIEDSEEGLVVHLARSKADQEGEGAAIGVPYGSNRATCPVRAYRAWLAASGVIEGPIFRAINRHGQLADEHLTDRSVARVVQRTIMAAAIAEGLSEAEAATRAAQYAGHSLRAGLATSAAANDAPGHAIQRQLRHARFDTTMKYIRAGSLFKENAAAKAGL